MCRGAPKCCGGSRICLSRARAAFPTSRSDCSTTSWASWSSTSNLLCVPRSETGLARVSDAPTKIIRTLAFDDAIEVAAPVLEHSVRLNDAALVENARSKSQGHLLAISRRSVLTESVTDILVNRGNHQVIASTIDNRGARFSTSGMSTLVKKSGDNSDLALRVWSRSDISRQQLVKLFAQASEIVRATLEAADPRRAALIRSAVAKASEAMQAEVRAVSGNYAQALEHVRTLHICVGNSTRRDCMFSFAKGILDKTVVALSLMCGLPVGLIERALVQSEPEQLLLLAKAIDLSWETVKAMLALQAGRGGLANNRMDQNFAYFFPAAAKNCPGRS